MFYEFDYFLWKVILTISYNCKASNGRAGVRNVSSRHLARGATQWLCPDCSLEQYYPYNKGKEGQFCHHCQIYPASQHLFKVYAIMEQYHPIYQGKICEVCLHFDQRDITCKSCSAKLVIEIPCLHLLPPGEFKMLFLRTGVIWKTGCWCWVSKRLRSELNTLGEIGKSFSGRRHKSESHHFEGETSLKLRTLF